MTFSKILSQRVIYEEAGRAPHTEGAAGTAELEQENQRVLWGVLVGFSGHYVQEGEAWVLPQGASGAQTSLCPPWQGLSFPNTVVNWK